MKDGLSLELNYSRKCRFSVINIKKDIEVMAINQISNDKECKKKIEGGEEQILLLNPVDKEK